MKYDISKFNPCKDAVEFYKGFNTFEEAWNACPRGDWMLWIAQHLGVDIRPLTLAKGLCANTVRHEMTNEYSTNAVDISIKFGKGEATREQLDDAAFAVVYTAYTARAAARAATYAADAESDAAYAACAASDAAADAASCAESDAAYAANQKQTADICREVLTEDVLKLIKL